MIESLCDAESRSFFAARADYELSIPDYSSPSR
jgi:hypothetical protein